MVEQSNKNKSLLMGAAAAAALVGAALLYHFVFSDDGEAAVADINQELADAGLD